MGAGGNLSPPDQYSSVYSLVKAFVVVSILWFYKSGSSWQYYLWYLKKCKGTENNNR